MPLKSMILPSRLIYRERNLRLRVWEQDVTAVNITLYSDLNIKKIVARGVVMYINEGAC